MITRGDVYHMVAQGHMNDPRRLTAEMIRDNLDGASTLGVCEALVSLTKEGLVKFEEPLGWQTTDK